MLRPLVDSYGRVHRDLRISVTDRCNFRCTYCMPEEGMQWLPREDILTFEEIERLDPPARRALRGIDSIRLTGGEPTVRAHLPVLVSKLAAIRMHDGRKPDLSLTTNGATLRLARITTYAAAGLDRVNVSLDTLRRDRFSSHHPPRRPRQGARRHRRRAQGGRASIPSRSTAVIDAWRQRRRDCSTSVDFGTWRRASWPCGSSSSCRSMPTGGWKRDARSSPSTRSSPGSAAVHPLEPGPRAVGRRPPPVGCYADGNGDLGIVAERHPGVLRHCDRVRLTAEGQFRTCLFETREFDLRAILRAGGSDDDLAAEITRAVGTKWAGHAIGQVNFIRPARTMSQIGG
jgi:cyclic pyranopterin phosphate synthase